ncbi:unnamed protein product [Caenorhabditis nigoni]
MNRLKSADVGDDAFLLIRSRIRFLGLFSQMVPYQDLTTGSSSSSESPPMSLDFQSQNGSFQSTQAYQLQGLMPTGQESFQSAEVDQYQQLDHYYPQSLLLEQMRSKELQPKLIMQGGRSARKTQKRSQTSDRSQNVASEKMKKTESPVQIYKVQSLYRNGVDMLLRSDEPHAEERTRSLLTAARWRKVHLQSDSFKEGHLVTVLARMLSAEDERVLKKHYKSFSNETYGATTTQQMKHLIDQLGVKKDDVIFDLGSGIGQLVTFAASYANVAKAYGIETCDLPVDIAAKISENFQR